MEVASSCIYLREYSIYERSGALRRDGRDTGQSQCNLRRCNTSPTSEVPGMTINVQYKPHKITSWRYLSPVSHLNPIFVSGVFTSLGKMEKGKMSSFFFYHIWPNISREDKISQQALNLVSETTEANKVETLCSVGRALANFLLSQSSETAVYWIRLDNYYITTGITLFCSMQALRAFS